MAETLLSATEVLRLFASGEGSITDYVEGLLEAKKSWNHLNAVVGFDAEALLGAARSCDRNRANGKSFGSLHGLPFIAKDNIDTVALPTTACTPGLEGNYPPRNALVVQRLLDAGAILFGKANMHELAFGITNNHGAFGPTRNPYNPDVIPGGSSGGVAAAVAAGFVPFGLGSDTGGSVRIPAALCGICGLRPTLGRYPSGGVVPISHTRDTVGPIARTVSDLALIDGIIVGDSGGIKIVDPSELRIGIPRQYFYESLESEVSAIIEDALGRLSRAGATLVETDIQEIAELNEAVSFTVVIYEAKRDLEHYLEHSAPNVTFDTILQNIVSPDVKEQYHVIANENAVSEEAYRRAIEIDRPKLQNAINDYFETHKLDAYAVPSTCLTARPIGQDETVELNGQQVPTFGTFIRNADPSSNAGIPSVTVPAGMTSGGLPVGIMFEGPPASDRALLSLALAFETLAEPLPRPIV